MPPIVKNFTLQSQELFQLDYNRFERPVVQVLFSVFRRLAPTDFGGLVDNSLGFAIRASNLNVLIRQINDDAIQHVLVHRSFFMRSELDANYANLIVLELRLIVLRIHLNGIESAGRTLSTARL